MRAARYPALAAVGTDTDTLLSQDRRSPIAFPRRSNRFARRIRGFHGLRGRPRERGTTSGGRKARSDPPGIGGQAAFRRSRRATGDPRECDASPHRFARPRSRTIGNRRGNTGMALVKRSSGVAGSVSGPVRRPYYGALWEEQGGLRCRDGRVSVLAWDKRSQRRLIWRPSARRSPPSARANLWCGSRFSDRR